MSHYETRTITSTERKTILYYGLVVLIIGGGIGVYFPLFFDRGISSESLATYALASLAPLWADIFLPEDYWKGISRGRRMRIGATCAVGGLFSLGALFRNGKDYDMFFSSIGTLIILCLLYEVCVLSGRFQPENPPKTEDGGPEMSDNGTKPKLDKLGGGGLQ
ncbi:hypothetical protein Ajs_2955 [Acidovorax sp. JS42]|nr:hypothetical protein Ajs_2955 [Acidovorax sp. JS42]